MLEKAKNVYSQPVDNIGDKFYYLQKNAKLALFSKHSSLEEKALEAVNYQFYGYKIIDPKEIIEEFNKNSNGNNYKFENFEAFFNNINNHTKFDIFTINTDT